VPNVMLVAVTPGAELELELDEPQAATTRAIATVAATAIAKRGLMCLSSLVD
jgi:hypothetical protein